MLFNLEAEEVKPTTPLQEQKSIAPLQEQESTALLQEKEPDATAKVALQKPDVDAIQVICLIS